MKALSESEQRDYAVMLAGESLAALQARLRSLEATWGPFNSRTCVVRGLIDGINRSLAITPDPGHARTAYARGFVAGVGARRPWRPGDGLDTGECPGCAEAKH